MDINILKCQGTGNDFILIDEYSNDYKFNDDQRKKIAINFCNRVSSIGADGILFAQKSSICDARMRIFNSDGSEAEMCGNGLRCVGRYVMDFLKKDKIQVQTMKAKYNVKRAKDIYTGITTIEITISSVDFNVGSLPMKCSKNEFLFDKINDLSDKLDFSAVSITNPHIVSIVDTIDINVLSKVGKKANHCPSVFPKGVNVNFVKPIDDNSIYVKTYERGVGLTKSCGTGMTASSIISCIAKKQKLGSEINVYNDGGMIKCIVSKSKNSSYSVEFIGNATYIFKSTLTFDFNTISTCKEERNMIYNNEISNYNKFLNYTRNLL